MNLSFGQKLLVAFGILLLLVMGAFTLSGNLRLQDTTDTYVDALIEDTVAQSTSSIADWLNTRLAMTEATANALESVETDAEARVILAAATTGGGFIDVYVGRDDGYMLMKDDASEATPGSNRRNKRAQRRSPNPTWTRALEAPSFPRWHRSNVGLTRVLSVVILP